MAQNARHWSSLTRGTESGMTVAAAHSSGMWWFAILACWWTLFIESLWSWAFLSPWPRWLHERRDWTVLVFVGTTYFLAPVHGFGTLLVVMGLARCDPRRIKTRVGYLIALIVLHLANPWTKLVYRNFLRQFFE